MKKIIFILFLSFYLADTCNAELLLQENKGQFPENVLFKAPLNFGALFVEKNKLTFVVHDQKQLSEILESSHHKKTSPTTTLFNSHSFSVEFVNANINSITFGENKATHHLNYFIGNDTSKWASKVRVFKDLWIKNVYPGIDFHLFGLEDKIKYEFVLNPNSNVNDIKMLYSNAQAITLANNTINIKTSVGDIVDESPVSYLNHNKQEIKTIFKLNNNTVSFALNYHKKPNDTIILDPALNFASFTGATIDNWGFTATYDSSGNAYAAGIAFGTGYPITTGAFQSNFGGGTNGIYVTPFPIDISISKFSSDGKSLLYSTFLGGNKQECPHSMVVTDKNELIVFGTTSSTNFPTSTNAYDKTFNGGTDVQVDNVLTFEGSDIIVTKFKDDGSGIIGSTYYGGSSNDGFNDETITHGLYHNYSDIYRGEVITDAAGDALIATSTTSSNLPIVSGFQNSFGGGAQDGCIAKFNSDLSQLIWSSYIGGTNEDAVYGLQSNSNGELYVTGGTNSNNFPSTATGAKNLYLGKVDGFISKISQNGSTLINSTYVGSFEYDQSYFVQIDSKNKVYVYGQTKGNMLISPNTFNNSNSGQFIQKFSEDLTTLEISTLVGSGSGDINLVPSAFLVDNCGKIYISGWGGGTNSGNGGGNTSGMPLTPDAHQSQTDGSDFYLMVLDEDFASLNYATYYGSLSSEEHVDGGTSRFDKNGIVYQAVCAACGQTAFPTTASAYSNTNNSNNCNLAVFKFNATKLTAIISPLNNDKICDGDTVFFNQESNGGLTFKWIFDDGTEVNSSSTWKVFPKPGTYLVALVAFDPSECPSSDTTFTNVTVSPKEQPNLSFTDTSICFGTTLNYSTDISDQYTWSSLIDGTNDFSQTFSVNPDSSTTYVVNYKNAVCSEPIVFTVKVLYPPVGLPKTTNRCDYEIAKLSIPYQEDYVYTWNPSADVTILNDNAYFSPLNNTLFTVNIAGTCGFTTIDYQINVTTIVPFTSPDTIICSDANLSILASGGTSYLWTPNSAVSDSSSNNPNVNLQETTTLNVAIMENGCVKNEQVLIEVFDKADQPNDPDYTIHYGQQQIIELLPQYEYFWTPDDYLSCNRCNPVVSEAEKDITYYFTYTDENSCLITDSVKVNVIYDLYVPNAFTPNGDGLNDIFYAYSYAVKEFHMDIFNRWGEVIFSSNDLNEGWNGIVKKQEAQIDVYVWKITYVKTHTFTPIEIVGTVTLVR